MQTWKTECSTALWSECAIRNPIRARVLVAALISGLFVITQSRAEDDYLSALSAESSKIEQVNRARQEQQLILQQMKTVQRPATPVAAISGMGAIASEELEQQIRPYSAAWALYKDLDPNARRLVMEEYSRHGERARLSRAASAIQKIIELSVGTGKKPAVTRR